LTSAIQRRPKNRPLDQKVRAATAKRRGRGSRATIQVEVKIDQSQKYSWNRNERR